MSETDSPDRDDIPRVVAGSPTDDELAAIAAVFAQLAMERDITVQRVPPAPGRSAWSRTLRPLRFAPPMHTEWSDPQF